MVKYFKISYVPRQRRGHAIFINKSFKIDECKKFDIDINNLFEGELMFKELKRVFPLNEFETFYGKIKSNKQLYMLERAYGYNKINNNEE
jgi:hypothetical protein